MKRDEVLNIIRAYKAILSEHFGDAELQDLLDTASKDSE